MGEEEQREMCLAKKNTKSNVAYMYIHNTDFDHTSGTNTGFFRRGGNYSVQ